ncbi:MAG: RelA/SpoT domain-containing protein [Thermoguttaceae bacterium]|nr:RelA/SpoT domain-containing protein [Thermoguttaceae bacterium]
MNKTIGYILQENGLSPDILEELSFKSELGHSLKKNLDQFEKEQLLSELTRMTEWLDENEILLTVALDYRVKSIESIEDKYRRYYPNHQVRKVFNDVLGFRAFCDDYRDLLKIEDEQFYIVDRSEGKSENDGYRGVHVYFQLDNRHYPIEIQFNTFFDRQLNNWLHDYLYKKGYPDAVGAEIRKRYEEGQIRNVTEFEEALNVLSGRKR